MNIKILGSGCNNCEVTYKHVQAALAATQVAAEVTKVTDFKEIMKYGVMKTPAVVIDEKVVIAGRVPSQQEVENLLK